MSASIDWLDYAVGDHRIGCPKCARRAADRTAGLTIGADGRGVLHCFRCGLVLTHQHQIGPSVKRAVQPSHEKRTTLGEWGLALWDRCQPVRGVAAEYLQTRKCRIPPADGDLRWCPALKHPSGYVGPALVALITDAVTRQRLSLHRTWITPTGKAALETPRLPLAGHSTAGGCIRLWPDEAVTVGLGVAEGIESALSLAWAYTPVWALIDAGHLSKFPVLDGIESLVIARDQDQAGIKAASECATRWARAGREVLATSQAQNDLNDVLLEEAA